MEVVGVVEVVCLMRGRVDRGVGCVREDVTGVKGPPRHPGPYVFPHHNKKSHLTPMVQDFLVLEWFFTVGSFEPILVFLIRRQLYL